MDLLCLFCVLQNIPAETDFILLKDSDKLNDVEGLFFLNLCVTQIIPYGCIRL